jgi:hypothetical protein
MGCKEEGPAGRADRKIDETEKFRSSSSIRDGFGEGAN